MNRATLTALLGFSLLLTACPQTTVPDPSDGAGTAGPSNPGAPASLPSQVSLSAANALSDAYSAPFDGTWNLTGLPGWLSAYPLSGSGNVKTTLTLNRSAAALTKADVKQLSAGLQLLWKAHPLRGGAAGTTTLNVSADLYHLTGQVSGQISAQGPSALSVLPAAPLRVNPSALSNSAGARGVIVNYKTESALLSALPALTAGRVPNRGIESLALPVQSLSLAAQSGQTLKLDTSDVSATLSALRADPSVNYAVPDAVLRAQDVPVPALQAPYLPSDEYAQLQYAYRLMGYSAVWRDMKNTPYLNPVTVAVIDTGVRFDHPDFAGRLWKSGEGALDIVTTDAYGPDTDPTDPGESGTTGSHGTHVSGIIAAGEGSFASPCAGCSTSGVVGAALSAPIKVLPVRAIDRFGSASESGVAMAIDYASGKPITLRSVTYTNPHPAQVINLSLGGPISVAGAQPLCDAIASATQRGVLVVVAAGNGGGTQPYYPAACAGAVSVASVRPDAGGLPLHAEYSQRYPQVTLAAYGGADPSNPTYNMNLKLGGVVVSDSIFSTSWNYDKNQPSYQFESGTSQAAPQVSALAALLLSKGVASTPAQALNIMQDTATDLGTAGRDDLTGYGLINAAAALGAPAISNTFTFSILGTTSTFAPVLDAAGQFSAYLPDGDFQVLAGYDRSGNALGGEGSEPGAKASVTLGPSQPSADVGTLLIKP
ncbi:serine protease [Deinococcus psychrotolerans]|uniref:Serine protease n=1 Tax=Deinococcus psychrotolerans TaxID=2489213 RepID=A0A3G8YCY1_9DEIO|nr:S8 family serine peptidase [Deinococcus psychrotolerans]AZI42835.1 serine protease [Deinococcus psychrotolerans]